MRLTAANWVPPGAWLAPGYAEWQAPAALRGAVACLWARFVPDGDDHPGLVLPDGCSDLIWEQGVGAYVAGPDTGPARPRPGAGTVFVGARFRPAAGGQVLGLPLSELRDRRVALADLDLGRAARGLPATLDPAAAAARVRRPDRAAARRQHARPRHRRGGVPAARPGRAHRGRRRAGRPERAPVPPPRARGGRRTGRRRCSGSCASSASSGCSTPPRSHRTWPPSPPGSATPTSPTSPASAPPCPA